MSEIKLFIVTNNKPVILKKQLHVDAPPSWMVVTDDVDEISDIPDGATVVSYMVGPRIPKSPQELALAERRREVSIVGIGADQYQFLCDVEAGKRSLSPSDKSKSEHQNIEQKEKNIA